MKKTLFVLITAMVLVFAFAATAMANTSSGTITWSAAAPNNSPATPHKGYAYNTQKCLVCHAVHKASPTGQVLLGDTVANACNYCHVSTTGVSTVHVYNNDPATFATDTVFNHSNKCTACHPYFTGTYADSDADGNVTGSSGVGGPYNSHIMTSDFASYDPANGATATGIQVAWASSAYCTSCHDSGADTVADNFPHLTSGARFMKSAEYAGAAATAAASPTQDGVCLKCHRGSADTGVQFDF